MVSVHTDLAAEVASEPVHGAADVSHLLLRGEALDVPAVPQHPPGQRHHHEQSACSQISQEFRTQTVKKPEKELIQIKNITFTKMYYMCCFTYWTKTRIGGSYNMDI